MNKLIANSACHFTRSINSKINRGNHLNLEFLLLRDQHCVTAFNINKQNFRSANWVLTTETDWKLLSRSKMADRSDNDLELLSEYEHNKSTNDIVLQEVKYPFGK